jgi:hypothetical protein
MRSYIFVGKSPYPAQAYEFGDRERAEFGAQHYAHNTPHLFERIVVLCMRAGYPRFTVAETTPVHGRLQHPRIELVV